MIVYSFKENGIFSLEQYNQDNKLWSIGSGTWFVTESDIIFIEGTSTHIDAGITFPHQTSFKMKTDDSLEQENLRIIYRREEPQTSAPLSRTMNADKRR